MTIFFCRRLAFARVEGNSAEGNWVQEPDIAADSRSGEEQAPGGQEAPEAASLVSVVLAAVPAAPTEAPGAAEPARQESAPAKAGRQVPVLAQDRALRDKVRAKAVAAALPERIRLPLKQLCPYRSEGRGTGTRPGDGLPHPAKEPA